MDLITYTEDIDQLRLDIVDISLDADHVAHKICGYDDEITKLLITKIPTARKYNKRVSLVRNINQEVIESIPSMEVIGWLDNGEYKFYPYGKDKYESVYNVLPVTYTDEDGEQTYTPPYMMGVFA
jgi:hypothetical protein